MKSILKYSIAFVLLTVCIENAIAETKFEANGFWFKINDDRKSVTLMPSSSKYEGLTINIPPYVTYLGIRYTVTVIGGDAFRNHFMLYVNIPNTVTRISALAFNCCDFLLEVTIPNSVTSIGRLAFGGCRRLKSITIGNSVTFFGSEAFYNCSGLRDVYCYANPYKITYYSSFLDHCHLYVCTLHVLPEYLSKYQTMLVWQNFYKIIADLEDQGCIEMVRMDELDRALPMDVYNLNGVKVGDNLEDLPAGIYIVHQGNKSAKVVKR